jgi:hypothetical protein
MDTSHLYIWVESDENYIRRRFSLMEFLELLEQAKKEGKRNPPKNQHPAHIYPED